MSHAASTASPKLFMVLGNQLFPLHHLKDHATCWFFMAEDAGLCTYVRHHKLKLVLFLAAMRAYADGLRDAGFKLDYLALSDRAGGSSYEDALGEALDRHGCSELVCFEIEDRFFAQRIGELARTRKAKLTVLPSPMFLTSRQEFADYLGTVSTPRLAGFYQRQRKRLKILVDSAGRPTGGSWSFDAQNRRRLPKNVAVPPWPGLTPTRHVEEVSDLVEQRFPDHPGSVADFWLPTTRRQALEWVDAFLEDRLALFGDYEDALSRRGPVLFHSVLSPVLNLGLITPGELIDRVLSHACKHQTPLNSLEGFVRQVIGWREFIRGIDHHFGRRQEQSNYWGHHRGLNDSWYRGTTGIPPLDDAIAKALKYGWTHHIERLMVLGNLMLLCEIEPAEAYRWFMEMFVDSSDWVMGPNVYGMALFSDGGIFATKPYICGSNYLLKMSDYARGPWCDVVDGLYWRFVDRHRDFFASNPRLAVAIRTLDRIPSARKELIFTRAERFLADCTRPGRPGGGRGARAAGSS
jgi:deoxyribodipyrimidine photolyase-related protein